MAAPSGFWRLNDRLREAIVRILGWRELRPVQDMSIDAILDGENAIVLAPTAGGKTEAAILPVVSAIADNPGRGIQAIFMSPLRALLNNQEGRIEQLAGLVGLRAFKWHGDVDARHKKMFVDDPAEIVLITPESLEVILATSRYDKTALFGGLRFIIVDEIHAFAGDDRGDHLVALVERLTEYARGDIQRVGLSATVKNTEVLLEWIQGSSTRTGCVVDPPREKASRVIEVHPMSDDDQAAARAANLVRDKKALFFADSRGACERMRTALNDFGVPAVVHHSSVSRAIREDAERMFRSSGPCCVVCTSSMELGLDIGDLDIVLQLGAPNTVSSFMQRLGRTGRRPETKGHFAFLTDEEWEFLQAISIVSLAARGEVEPIHPSRRAAHVFVHQVLARVLQYSGLNRARLIEGVGKPYCFSDLPMEQRESVVDHLIETTILTKVGGVLTFGERGERAFSASNFLALYAVFDTPQQLTVRTIANREVGMLDVWFAQSFRDRDFVFVLGGKAWEAVEWDWDKAVLLVKEAERGKVPSWSGSPRLLPRTIAEEIRGHLIESKEVAFLSPNAQRLLDRMRAHWGELLRPARLVIARHGNDVYLYTFAGGRINNVFARAFEHAYERRVSVNNLSIRFPLPSTGAFDAEVRQLLEWVRDKDSYVPEILDGMVSGLPRGRLSKFQAYLPPDLECRLILDRLFDLDGAMIIASAPIVSNG